MTRCCRCGCDKINFKVFDFANGTLLWEALVQEPQISTDNYVYSIAETEVVEGEYDNAGSSDTFVLKTWERRDPANGTILDSSSPIHAESVIGLLSGAGAGVPYNHKLPRDGLFASNFAINDNGETIKAPHTMFATRQADIGQANRRYYIGEQEILTGSITIGLVSSGAAATAWSPAVIDVTDNAATIEATLALQFQANLISVTVTGDTLSTQLMIIDVELANADVDFTILSRTALTTPSEFRLVNLRTGIWSTSGTWTWPQPPHNEGRSTRAWTWATSASGSQKLVTTGSDITGAGWKHVVRWMDTTTEPWSVLHSEEPWLAGDGTTLVDDVPTWLFNVYSKNGITVLHHHPTDLYPLADGGIANLTTYNETTYAKSTLDDNQLMIMPSVAIEDSDTNVGFTEVSWTHRRGDHPTIFQDYGFFQTGQDQIKSFKRVDSTAGSTSSGEQNTIARGDLQRIEDTFDNQHSYYVVSTPTQDPDWALGRARGGESDIGFDSTATGFYFKPHNDATAEELCELTSHDLTQPVSSRVNAEGSSITTDVQQGTQSGLIHSTTLVPMYWAPTEWEFHWPTNAGFGSGTKWRLRFSQSLNGPHTPKVADEVTTWFDAYSDGAATVNAALLAQFGSIPTMPTSTPNFEFETYTADPRPMILQRAVLKGYAATSYDHADEQNIPRFMTMGTLHNSTTFSTPSNTVQIAPHISIEYQDFAPLRTKTFGAIALSDGATIWERNWRTSNTKDAVLQEMNDGYLYVHGPKICAEGVYGGS